ncbi:MAG: endonuclease/exonuclease/phosphatase family protein [Coriobacteriales bacterium]|jgi:endonuclease/exonuclease/phosphatase family metal-dependent hydrolase
MGKHNKRKGRRWLRVLLRIVAAIVIVIAALLIAITVTEYRPADTEDIAIEHAAPTGAHVSTGDEMTILSWNTGYGALGENADFFMDGGTHVMTDDEPTVRSNLASMQDAIADIDPDIVFLQEVDLDAKRSHGIDEVADFANALAEAGQAFDASFAYNYKAAYVPYPWPTLGHIEAGVMTLSSYPVESATRMQLPCPFKWPVRSLNLKRCLLESRIPVLDENGADTGKELVLINLHLEAYDSGEGKIAQTKMLRRIMADEAMAGNYVIAGGDFNQTFRNVDTSAYPIEEGHWAPGEIDPRSFPGGFHLLMDPDTPTCRSLATPYAGADKDGFVFYVIDGFIVSGNVKAKPAETLDYDFQWTDHNPVLLTFELE